MNANHRSHSAHSARCGSLTPPSTIWLPTQPIGPEPDDWAGRGGENQSSESSGVLPGWAVRRVRREFTRPRQPGELPLPLLRLDIPDSRPGMDTRARRTGEAVSVAARRAVILAELHPDALPARWGCSHPEAIDTGEWPGFFHRAHHLLARGGFLLIAARQQRIAGRLTDPLGTLVACARTAGFTYLQHIVVVHGHPTGDRIIPAPAPGMPPGLLHSDLLALHTPGRR